MSSATSRRTRTDKVRVSHCADFCRRYPGETAALFTKVQVQAPLTAFTLRIALPPGSTLTTYRTLDDRLDVMPETTWSDGTNYLTWRESGELEPGDSYEYLAEADIGATHQDVALESQAALSARTARGGNVRDQESTTILVAAQGQSIQYLPALYRDDDLMGRFLMLFESFWTPIQRQIESLPYYFDPKLAPIEFLPWLASWIDLTLDEQWSEERRRQVLGSAISLFRKRGTHQGLTEYLEIFTGSRPHITEYRAQNLTLGRSGQLGRGVALGKDNVPHKFIVRLELPPIESGGSDRERERREQLRRRKIEAIIDAQKPAHTQYWLYLE